MNKQLKGSLALLGATVIWGTAFVAQSVGMDLVGPFTFQSARCVLAVLILFPTALIWDVPKYGLSASLRRWLDPKLWKVGAICGCALFVAANLQQVGLVYTDAGKAGFITAMYIVLVPILGFFLHQKPPKAAVISVLIAVIGLYMLSCIGVTQINIGDVYLMGCALAFAVHITVIDRLAGSLDGIKLNCIQALLVAIASGLVAGTVETVSWSNLTACWLPIGYTGILSMGIAYSLQIIGQKDLEPTMASLIMSLESVFAVLGGVIILHETMTIWETIGCILVFSAVIISQIPSKKA